MSKGQNDPVLDDLVSPNAVRPAHQDHGFGSIAALSILCRRLSPTSSDHSLALKSRTAGGDLLPAQFKILDDKGDSMQGVGAMDRCAIVQQQVDRGKMSIVGSPRERCRVPSSFVCVDVSSEVDQRLHEPEFAGVRCVMKGCAAENEWLPVVSGARPVGERQLQVLLENTKINGPFPDLAGDRL